MSLYKKILEVMKEVQYLQKDDTVGEGTRAAYKGLSEEKVMKVFREAMIKHGLVMIPTFVESKTESHYWVENNQYGDKNKSSYFTQVSTNYKIIDTDTGESEVICSSGHGVDSQDKGAGKAMTYAHKYAILKLFMCPTGDDTDKTHSNAIEPINKQAEQLLGATNTNNNPESSPAVSINDLRNRCAEMLAMMREGDKTAQMELMQQITTTDRFVGYKSFKGLEITQVRVIYGKIKKYFKENYVDSYSVLAKKYNW